MIIIIVIIKNQKKTVVRQQRERKPNKLCFSIFHRKRTKENKRRQKTRNANEKKEKLFFYVSLLDHLCRFVFLVQLNKKRRKEKKDNSCSTDRPGSSGVK